MPLYGVQNYQHNKTAIQIVATPLSSNTSESRLSFQDSGYNISVLLLYVGTVVPRRGWYSCHCNPARHFKSLCMQLPPSASRHWHIGGKETLEIWACICSTHACMHCTHEERIVLCSRTPTSKQHAPTPQGPLCSQARLV